MGKIRKELIITGKVQGVGFRYFTKNNATYLDVNGWVRNLRNGDVEAVLEGEESRVNEMMEKLKSGPITARVDSVEVLKDENITDYTFNVFSVKY